MCVDVASSGPGLPAQLAPPSLWPPSLLPDEESGSRWLLTGEVTGGVQLACRSCTLPCGDDVVSYRSAAVAASRRGGVSMETGWPDACCCVAATEVALTAGELAATGLIGEATGLLPPRASSLAD